MQEQNTTCICAKMTYHIERKLTVKSELQFWIKSNQFW